MLVYVIHKQRLFSLTLPSNIYGSYSVMDVDNNNKERLLINITEREGRWVAFSNKHVKIWQDNQQLDEVLLDNYQYLLLQVKGEEGFLVMYCCPVNDTSMKSVSVSSSLSFSVGRGVDNAISCNNPLIADSHAQITYKDGVWLLNNLDDKYGTFVNGKVVMNSLQLFHGDVIFIMGLKLIVLGNTVTFNNPLGSVKYDKNIFSDMPLRESIVVSDNFDEDVEISLYDDGDFFVRSPRFMEIIEEKNFIFDEHPSIAEPDDAPVLLTVGPMLTMGMTSVVMLSTSLISYQDNGKNLLGVLPTVAISISMLAGTLLWPSLNKSYNKKKMLKKKKEIEEKYGNYLLKKEKELVEIAALQRQILLSNNISPLDCYKLIMSKSRNLWMRELHQKDFLTLRLGIGKVPLKIKFTYPEEHFKLDEDNLDDRMKIILENHKYIEGVPVTESFTSKNIVAVTGKEEFTYPYLDNLILQMITFHSYFDLKLVFLTDSANDRWNYLKQLPHIFSNDKQIRFFATNFDEGKEVTSYLLNIFNAREENFSKENSSTGLKKFNFAPYFMIITDSYDSVKDYPLFERILHQNNNLGFSILIINQTLANLPTECKSFIGINSLENGGIFESELSSATQRSFAIEQINQVDFNACSLMLANLPIENNDDTYTLPKTYSFLEMYDAGNVEQLNSLEKWKINNPIISLSVPVGISTNGNLFKLDLHEKEAGPHGLIAGMTGSGKSEFIITYILSMAVNFHPNEVQFVLIDYKGGGLVGAFLNKEAGISLPHLAGTITNLDTADINRALSSIESELKRRQSLFNMAREKLNEGTIDIYKYQKYYREGLLDEPISHLFIISDEFAELKSQQPEFMEQLISTARIGRSLGVHLILATQKPSGVVNDQIWSNSRFRVCLKVQDAGDSNEVIKRPDAASLKETGRFYLQVGYNEFFAMGQAAYAGGPYIAQDKVYHDIDNKINFINNIGKSFKMIDAPRKNINVASGEELSNIVKYLDGLAEKENISVRQLWLDKIPEIIFVDDIKKKYHYTKKPFALDIVFGVYDNPGAQRQDLLTLDLLHKGNVVIYSMNEKNTIINTIIYSLITTYHTKELNLYVMDFDSQTLKGYKKAPQVGDVVFSNETEKVDKLFKLILNEIENRKRLFENYNGSYEFYCKNSGKTVPGIVYIMHGYENFKESFEEKDTMLSKIAREGAKYGVYTILTAISDRSLRLSMRSNFTQIIPLKLSSTVEYNMLLGKKAPAISECDGRGVALVDDCPYEFQTASIINDNKQVEYLKVVIDNLNEQILEKAPVVPILPDVVTWNDVVNNNVILNQIPIGMEEDTLKVSTFDFTSSVIQLINASDIIGLAAFSKVLIEKLVNNTTAFMTVVCDMKKLYSDSNIIKSLEFSVINDLIFNITRDKRLLVFITGVDKWINNLDSSIKNDLVTYFSRVSELNNCTFVFVDRVDDLKSFAYEKWFKQFIVSDNSIFVGRGLNNSTIHNLVTPLRSLSVPIPSNYGYNIKNGIATRIKLIEGDSDYAE